MNVWRNSAGIPGGKPQELREDLCWNSWRNSTNIPGGTLQKFLEKLHRNSWRNFAWIPEGISSKILEELGRNYWRNYTGFHIATHQEFLEDFIRFSINLVYNSIFTLCIKQVSLLIALGSFPVFQANPDLISFPTANSVALMRRPLVK